MLVLRPIAAGQSRYYLEGPAPGRWTGAGSDDLGLGGPVDAASLHAVLAGRQPGGDVLLERVPAARRSGFDLILAAPKSVSLLAVLGDDEHHLRFRRAEEQAVASVLGYLEREAVWTRRGAAGIRIPTSGLVAAAFPHSMSAALDPHLHTHVVVANLVRGDDDRWSSLDSRSLYRHAGAAGAIFQAGLRHHLAEQGYRFDWKVNGRGLGDISGVSRAAIDAASCRHRQVVEEIETGMAGRMGRATAAGRTRLESELDSSPGSRRGWEQRVAAAGLDRATATQLLETARAHRVRARDSRLPGPDTMSLTRLLGEQHSQFRRTDVVRAAAALAVGGAAAASLEALADDFLRTALPAGGDMWTTVGLKRLEERIVAVAIAPTGPDVGMVTPGTPSPAGLTEVGRQAVDRLTRGGAPADVLGGDLISQAQVLEAARVAWEASGHRVGLASPTERGLARWRILAGLEQPPSPPGHPTVVLVDNADRWSTTDLHRVMADAAARQAKVVLLDGGTMPRRKRAESPALEQLRDALVPIDTGPAPQPGGGTGPPEPVVHAGRGGTVTLAATGWAAMEHLVDDWHRRHLAGERPRMVALGPEEAEHLNAMARAVRVRAGELDGASVEIGGRRFQVGDEVAALRRDARLGAVPGGTVGRVTAVDPQEQLVDIQWQGLEHAVTAATAGARRPLPLTHGYATTPPYLRGGHAGPILSLGHIEALAPRVHPDRIYEVVPAPASNRMSDHARDQLNAIGTLRAEIPHRPAERQRTMPEVTRDAGRPVAELVAERDGLAARLQATVPPDPGPELRRLREERDWLASVPDRLRRPDHVTALRALDERRATLGAAAGRRTEWLEDHRDELERWSDLSYAVAWREAALGRGAEVRPTVAVASALGPPPTGPAEGAVWRRAAAAIEAHREQWALPDRPLDLSQPATAQPDLRRRAGELRVLTTSGELRRTRDRDRSLSPSGR